MAKILVIEDEPVSRKLLRMVLSLAAHEVLEAQDGLSGMDLAARNQPDLIVLDLTLPHLDGWAVLARLREQGVTAPVVAVTGHALVGDRERILAAGFDGYMSKPIDVRTFNQALEAYLPC
ncbi:response regulator [Gloeobacter kilaueensis]|uniref:Hybrid sensory kinase in two-component regulatory system with RcsB and YojN n=1 Tax=Gloeobacter kilaueensis (strain ATCC BAA-2537 / CCAP 1431/1 / ULC 316 / JS1) TaxID=1183438 RepID=U5QM78_GLOK1|nr:response regulator [Gloeobacter kilaueensis]AGY59978.1 hybrid sensory kinase in two-component regulatory system with RcsB and YojN [Gloeobacter kilaueensis JS1]